MDCLPDPSWRGLCCLTASSLSGWAQSEARVSRRTQVSAGTAGCGLRPPDCLATLCEVSGALTSTPSNEPLRVAIDLEKHIGVRTDLWKLVFWIAANNAAQSSCQESAKRRR